MKYQCKVSHEFKKSHFIPGHETCGVEHEHNWKIVLIFEHEQLEFNVYNGMIIDFLKVEETLDRVINEQLPYCLNGVPEFNSKPPTSENLAFFFWHNLTGVEFLDNLIGVEIFGEDWCSGSYYR
jgi:6-pyruvoyltetrahydropterin/6-carboxytetrahydropterin synthase